MKGRIIGIVAVAIISALATGYLFDNFQAGYNYGAGILAGAFLWHWSGK